MERIRHLVIDRAPWVLALTALLSIAALSQLIDLSSGEPRLEVDPALDRLIPDQGEEREYYERMRRLFGSDETIVVALVADDVFTPPVLSSVSRLTERLKALDGVHQVVSLSSALNIRGVDGDLEIEPFLVDIPEDPAELVAMRREVLENPIYSGNLVSSSGRATAVIVYLLDMDEREYVERGLDAAIESAAAAEGGDAGVWITGSLRIKSETRRIASDDLGVVLPLAFGIAGLVALLSFRTLRGVLVPGFTILIALLWTLASVSALGRSLTLVTVILPALLLTIGFAYTVHVIVAYNDAVGEGEGSSREAARRAFDHVSLPVFLTALTTCIGFLSLCVSPITAIQEFGIFATLGIFYTLVLSLSFVPALLTVLPLARHNRSQQVDAVLDRFAARLARFDLDRRFLVLGFGLAVAVLCVVGATRIRVSTNVVGGFAADAAVRKHFEAVNEELEGSNPFSVVLQADYRDAFKDPAVLKEIEALQRWLEEQPGVGSTTSVVDYLKLINWGFHENDPAHLAIPENKRLTTQLLFFGANDEIEGFVDLHYQTANVVVRSKYADTGDLSELVARVEARLGELPEFLTARVTSNSVLLARAMDDLTRGQVRSLGLAFLAIYLILAALFTSLRVGFVALIPNVLPVLVYFGAMGLAGVTLNATTSLGACIVLGIAVDDTIHYLSRFNVEARRLADERAGTIAAVTGIFRPVTYTTAALCLGFLALCATSLRGQIELGALGAFTLAFAWLADVTITPALCSSVRIATLWDVLTLDLGPEPHRSIPIFNGLTRGRARVVALMTSLSRFPRGTELFRAGDKGEEMYVVVDGELEVSLDTASGRQVLATMRRGDTLGEVALFHGKRTADDRAATDVRLLRLTQEDLDRLRRRYPRISAQLHSNLSRILADLVARTTDRLR